MANSNGSKRSLETLLEDVARRNELSSEAVHALLQSLKSGGYSMAQFNHPDLGGMGQWSGGMTMIGDFSNSGLKERVASACRELVAGIQESTAASNSASNTAKVTTESVSEQQPHEQSLFSPYKNKQNWWPDTFETVSSSGSQNQSDYAYSPSSHRLAVRRDGRVTIYDTGSHEIHGVSQQQGSSNSLVFESQLGKVTEADLKPIG